MDKKPPKSPPVPPGRVGRQENGFYNPPAASTVKLATPPVPSDRVGSLKREFYKVPVDTRTPEPARGPTKPWRFDFDGLIEALGRPHAPTPLPRVAPDRLSPRGHLDRDRSRVAGPERVGHIPPHMEVYPPALAPGIVEPSLEDTKPQRHLDERPTTLRPSAVEEGPERSPPDCEEDDDNIPPPKDQQLRASPGVAPQPHKGPSKGPHHHNNDAGHTEAPKLGTSVPAPPVPAPAPALADTGPTHATVAAPQLRPNKTTERAAHSRLCHLLGIAPLHARPPDNRRQRQRPQGAGARRRKRRRHSAGTAPLHARPPDSRRQRQLPPWDTGARSRGSQPTAATRPHSHKAADRL
ncbi:uncharacterized protein LOC134666950 [Cydia fagiglandana]|uniref:uncharacterized protein LOC134666947 n=1 Tax=Cydia fagiglandana TaxID=1458189 RepID=UPI002FEE20FB